MKSGYVEFEVLGEPVAKGRPKFSMTTGRTYTPAKTVNYENLVKLSYQAQIGNKMIAAGIPIEMKIEAYFGIPQSKSKKQKREMAEKKIFPTKKPDADNLIKSICDALNCVAFYDDSQVVKITVNKFYGEEPKVVIMIGEYEGC